MLICETYGLLHESLNAFVFFIELFTYMNKMHKILAIFRKKKTYVTSREKTLYKTVYNMVYLKISLKIEQNTDKINFKINNLA